MGKVTLDEIIGLDRYNQVRDQFRRRIISLKKARRVSVGDLVTFVFENHETVLFQIQEMLRTEHITDLDKIRFELATYNPLIPGAGTLSATMLIEITDPARVRSELIRLIGIDQAVSLRIGEEYTIPAVFEAGRSKEDNLSAVQYVSFSLPSGAHEALRCGRQPVRLLIDHPYYRAHAVLAAEVRQSLAADL